MAIPCYAYKKLKMPGPYDIIAISSDPQCAHEAETAILMQAKAQLAHTNNRTERIATAGATQ